MKTVATIADIKRLRENREVECKLAQGRDGRGKLPQDMWESYCAFANTRGGDIFLGLKEKSDGSFALAGISNTNKVLDELWCGLNDRRHVSYNILNKDSVKILSIDGVDIIQIHVPPASVTQKPIYLGGNPATGSYLRERSADVLMPIEQVELLLAQRHQK